MKCDATDCDFEATHFECLRNTARGDTYYGWCENCIISLTEEELDSWGISREEYLVAMVMKS